MLDTWPHQQVKQHTHHPSWHQGLKCLPNPYISSVAKSQWKFCHPPMSSLEYVSSTVGSSCLQIKEGKSFSQKFSLTPYWIRPNGLTWHLGRSRLRHFLPRYSVCFWTSSLCSQLPPPGNLTGSSKSGSGAVSPNTFPPWQKGPLF